MAPLPACLPLFMRRTVGAPGLTAPSSGPAGELCCVSCDTRGAGLQVWALPLIHGTACKPSLGRRPPCFIPRAQLEADRISLRLVQKLLAAERHARVLEVASTLHNMPALQGALKLANHHRSDLPPLW